MREKPLTVEIVLTVLIALGLVCSACILTGPSWAHLVPNLPARSVEEPTLTAVPISTPLPDFTPTPIFIEEMPQENLQPLDLPTSTSAAPPPIFTLAPQMPPPLPVPTPTPTFTRTPIPSPTLTPFILLVPTWPVANPTFTPWVGPTPTPTDEDNR